jgi:hypothetical protein
MTELFLIRAQLGIHSAERFPTSIPGFTGMTAVDLWMYK